MTHPAGRPVRHRRRPEQVQEARRDQRRSSRSVYTSVADPQHAAWFGAAPATEPPAPASEGHGQRTRHFAVMPDGNVIPWFSRVGDPVRIVPPAAVFRPERPETILEDVLGGTPLPASVDRVGEALQVARGTVSRNRQAIADAIAVRDSTRASELFHRALDSSPGKLLAADVSQRQRYGHNARPDEVLQIAASLDVRRSGAAPSWLIEYRDRNGTFAPAAAFDDYDHGLQELVRQFLPPLAACGRYQFGSVSDVTETAAVAMTRGYAWAITLDIVRWANRLSVTPVQRTYGLNVDVINNAIRLLPHTVPDGILRGDSSFAMETVEHLYTGGIYLGEPCSVSGNATQRDLSRLLIGTQILNIDEACPPLVLQDGRVILFRTQEHAEAATEALRDCIATNGTEPSVCRIRYSLDAEPVTLEGNERRRPLRPASIRRIEIRDLRCGVAIGGYVLVQGTDGPQVGVGQNVLPDLLDRVVDRAANDGLAAACRFIRRWAKEYWLWPPVRDVEECLIRTFLDGEAADPTLWARLHSAIRHLMDLPPSLIQPSRVFNRKRAYFGETGRFPYPQACVGLED